MNAEAAAPAPTPGHGLPDAGLPLTVFEEHMLAEDKPAHPMVILMRLDFGGSPAVTALAAAFDATLRAEPLLTARVRHRRLGRPRWFAGAVPELVVSRSSGEKVEDLGWIGATPRLDPFAGPMVHAEVVSRSDGWSILVAVHHAAADGLGIVGFVERWLLAAAGLEESQRRRPNAAALATRGRVAASWTAFFRMLPRLAVGLQGVRQFVARRVISLDGRCDGPAAPPPAKPWQPAVAAATLAAADVQALDRRARSLGVSANDLLVAAYVSALADADAGEPERTADAWIRVGVPISLRTKSDYSLPAANRVSMVFLDRRPVDRSDEDALIRGIHAEMEYIRLNSLGHIFPLTLECGRVLPGGLKRMADRPEPQCTAVLSNLGRCFHRSPLTADDGQLTIGGSRLIDWWIVPPVRPGTAVAAATHETAGRRTIAIQFDPVGLAAADARDLLERIVADLREPVD